MKFFTAALLAFLFASSIFAQNPAADNKNTKTENTKTENTNSSQSKIKEPAPFTDVPKDHWAYESVRKLQKAGILTGYPDGTFNGKKTMTRDEFAAAIARMIPTIRQMANNTQVTRQQIEDLERRISALESGEVAPPAKPEPTPPTSCTKSECESLKKLVDEFSVELKRMRVNVDALKKDVAKLNDRVKKVNKQKFP